MNPVVMCFKLGEVHIPVELPQRAFVEGDKIGYAWTWELES
jgi:hypothetical protein